MSESRLFKIVIFIFSGFFAGLSLANIIYYARILRGDCRALSHGEAQSMLWVNVAVFILSIIIFLWSIWRLLFPHHTTTYLAGHVATLAAPTTVTAPVATTGLPKVPTATVVAGSPKKVV